MKTALLLRVNAWHEIWGTHAIVNDIKQRFDVDDVWTVATPQTEALNLLQHDSRFKEIILFPPAKDQQKTPQLWRKVILQHKFDFNILAFYGELPENHFTHVFSLIVCPGKKYFYQHGIGFFSMYSLKGILLLLKVIRSKFYKRFKIRWEQMLSKKPSQIPADLSKEPIKKILWMRPDHLGDVLMTLPTLKVLKHYFPEAEIDALIRPDAAEMLKSVSDINRIYLLNIEPYTETPMDKARFQQLTAELSARRYDMSIDFRGDDTLRKLAGRLNIPFRVGHSGWKINQVTNDYSFLLTHPIDFPASLERSIERNIALLDGIGLHSNEIVYDFDVGSQRLHSVQETLRIKKIPQKIAVIHAQSRDYLRGWVPEKFAEVADYLVSHYGLHTLIIGASVNSEYNERIIHELKFPDKVHNAAGWFTLEELPALLKMASIMVTIDSGPMHMAAAVGTPIVALMLPRFVKASYPAGKDQRVLVPDVSEIVSLIEEDDGHEGIMLNAVRIKKVTDAIDSVLCKGQGG